MPRKNKKGKASKLARMSDEERIRYLQHRAELELEAKRRKQQLIAIFTKNKLRREEDFARINNAKLNEQWRIVLRKLKCTSLKDNIQYLRQNFEEILIMKDDFIKRLLDGLLEINFDHKRFQVAHIEIIDNIIGKGRERINYLQSNYDKCIKIIEVEDIKNLQNHKENMKQSLMYLQVTNFAKNEYRANELDSLKTKHAINIHTILYDKNESILQLKYEIYPVIESLWQQLNEIITMYENSTENIRKQYEFLKKQDDIHQLESAHFPEVYTKLSKNAEALKKEVDALVQEREESIEESQTQSDLLTKRLCKLRQETKVAETIDAAQLKQLSVLTNEVIKDLQRIVNKSMELQTILKLCLETKLDSLDVERYSFKTFDNNEQLIKLNNEPLGFLKKVEGFHNHLNDVKEENDLLRKERNHLLEENNRLKHCLRLYLMSMSRMPTICPIKSL